MQSAEQQGQKAGFDKKAYRANFLPKLSATGLYAYVHKKMKFDIDGGYLPVYDVNDVGQAVPLNSLYMPEGKPVLGADGYPCSNNMHLCRISTWLWVLKMLTR